MRINYVLIDLENVKPTSIELLNHDHFRVMVFVGSNQAKVALDFHIAYYIGRLAKEDANAHFHIISKDAGFDPLIKHLRTQKISAHRAKSIDDIPLVKSTKSKPLPNRIDVEDGQASTMVATGQHGHIPIPTTNLRT